MSGKGIEWEGKSVEELRLLADRYLAARGPSDPTYLDALRHWEQKRHPQLKFEKTLALISRHARAGSVAIYQQVAAESKVPFNVAQPHIGKHLAEVCRYANGKGWPLVTAIVVNKDLAESHDMTDRSRGGFIAVARELGRFDGVTEADERMFLANEQTNVFDWGKTLNP